MAQSLLLDLDGVVRVWDPAYDAALERRHGLPPGALAYAVFGPGSALADAVTGRISDEEWRTRAARVIADDHGPSAAAVVEAWSESAGGVDEAVLAVVRRARAAGWRVGLLTNATTRLRGDLARLGLDAEVDVVVSSAELGVAKPDPRAFLEACRLLGAAPAEVVFVDDSHTNVAAAAAVGLDAHLHQDAAALAALLGV